MNIYGYVVGYNAVQSQDRHLLCIWKVTASGAYSILMQTNILMSCIWKVTVSKLTCYNCNISACMHAIELYTCSYCNTIHLASCTPIRSCCTVSCDLCTVVCHNSMASFAKFLRGPTFSFSRKIA